MPEINVMNDETLHKGIRLVSKQLADHDKIRDFLYRVRDDICSVVRCCADNVEVIIYIDDVLDDPIKCSIGDCENRLRITIKSNGKVTADWTNETWSKVLKDAGTTISDFVKDIVKKVKTGYKGEPEAIEALRQGAIDW